jgi:hypothetical protein
MPNGQLGMCFLVEGSTVVRPPGGEMGMSQWREIEPSAVIAFTRRLKEYEKSMPSFDWEPSRLRSFAPSLDHDYNVNRVLRVFDLVRVEPGYLLDYMYLYDGNGGQPFLYARPADGTRVTSKEEYSKRFQLAMPDMLLGHEPTDEDSRPYLDHMAFEETDLGFLQFALFCMTARRFQLYWHSNYNNRIYILDNEERAERLRTRKFDLPTLSDEELGVLPFLDIRPKIRIYGDSGWVRLFNYEMNRGFSYCTIEVEWPNRLCGIVDEIMIESRSEVMY